MNKKKQKMENKDDFNCKIVWSIKNDRLKSCPELIHSEGGKYFAYANGDDFCISPTGNKKLYNRVVKDFNILESEKLYLKKYMYDFSVKDLYTLDTNTDFVKFLHKYNFNLRVIYVGEYL